MRHLFFLFLILLAPLAPLHSAQKPPDAAEIDALLSLAEQGDATAQDNLGVLYYYGRGVAQDYVAAREWFLKAAEQGHPDAQGFLGIVYGSGQGVTRDYAEARKWYLKAAEQGYVGAQCNLGSLYYYGRGIAQDYVAAREWFLKAAEQGLVDASLGRLYDLGLGVAQDYTMAYVWYNLADAEKERDVVAANLDATSLTEARKLSKEYFKRYVAAQARTTYADVVAGMKCTQSLSGGHLECDYRVGRSLHFAIVAPGKPDSSIYFYSASVKGDYFAVLGLLHGCVIVRPGQGASQAHQRDLAFVSPRNGKVYRTWQDCGEGK